MVKGAPIYARNFASTKNHHKIISDIERETAVWLRFYDRDGNLVLLPEEVARQQAETERQRAETAEQRGALRQLLRLLTTRFGTVSPEVAERLQALDLNQLEDLVEVALAVDSLVQFVSRLG